MKQFFFICTLFTFLTTTLHAQGFKGLVKNVVKKDSTGKISINNILTASGQKGGLTNSEIISGLKEALQVGAQRGSSKLSAVDGFFKDAALKILMPPDAKKVENTLRDFGMGKQVDNAILAMNRAAEDAAKNAAPIFINAVKQMSFEDALSILKGGDFAATNYLKGKTTQSLTEAFRPVIDSSLKKVNATKYWNTLFTTYNKFGKEKVNTDLSAYVTEKSLTGIFYQLGLEEQKIRKDPLARTSDILKKVFAN
ncbi:DUF4197 domain-containing protein [Chitinophagaceae bacterium LB-8]|uniref:DUF4197 domain-containing protein n=1 Tax=Paraflavisolibacter caeni TaxID=2982496 RepID=A0A9X3BJ73_9BACT|nr:DUF4197 domain-containing protein [Paraflavisolibacter caeni]MCU7550808.1 DUF4197 domain-containing protein [Paraflavisolibacter caeni]